MFTVMVGVLALVLQSGGLYWERRSLQATADAAALGAAMKLDPTCYDTTAASAVNEAVRLLDLHLGSHLPPSNVVPTGDCGSSAGQYTATATFPNSVTATIHYPYQKGGSALQVEVLLSQANALQFSAFLGVTSTTVPARAVAQWGGSYPGSALAAYSDSTIECIGNSDWTVYGTVYSRNAISSVITCGIEIRSIRNAGNSYQDFGNLMIFKQDDQNWYQTLQPGYSWNQTVQKSFKVEGWAAAGTVCAIPAAAVARRDASQLTVNPTPCPDRAVPDPARARPPVNNPNAQPGRAATYSATPPCADLPPISQAVGGPIVYGPGCYGKIDVSNPPPGFTGTRVVLNPGFYYFNGQGLCMGSAAGADLTGNDVTLEFASGASFSTGTCIDPTGPTQCGAPCTIGSVAAYLKAPYEDSAWCKAGAAQYPACLKVLVYQDPTAPATGFFYIDSPNSTAFMRGTVSWMGQPCTIWSNGGGIIQGQLLCQKIRVDRSGGGSAGGNSIYFHADDINPTLREPSLVE
jgi:hypothetical protein